MLFNIPFRGLGRKIELKTAPKSPEGDLRVVRERIRKRIGDNSNQKPL